MLYHNMKAGLSGARELSEVVRELAKLQEEGAKSHVKIIKQVS